jgi:hypothetical protein
MKYTSIEPWIIWRRIAIVMFGSILLGLSGFSLLGQTKSPVTPLLNFYSSDGLRAQGLSALNGGIWSMPRPISGNRLALLSTPNNGAETFLHLVQPGQSFPPPVATVKTLPDPAIRAATLSDGSVLVIADTDPGADRSFGSSLFRLVPGAPAVLLANHVVWASRPLVTPDGRVFIERGSAGGPTAQGIRVDSLSVEEVSPQSGSTRTIWSDTGYIAYLAGSFANDLILYDIRPSGARLILVDRDTGRERVVLPSLPAFANSFSVSHSGDLVFEDADPTKTHWIVERLNLVSGELNQLYESTSSQLVPYEWPQGNITLNDPARTTRGASTISPPPMQQVIDIQAVTDNGSAAVALASTQGRSLPSVVLLSPSGDEVDRIPVPENLPITVAGFVR